MLGWPGVRTFHMPGGLRVVELGGGETLVEPTFGEFKFQAESYGGAARSIKREVGLEIRACEIFGLESEIKGLQQPAWHPVMPVSPHVWPCKTAEVDWGGLACAADTAGAEDIEKIADSIRIQARYAAFAILNASDLYKRNLAAILVKDSDVLKQDNFWVYGYFIDNLYSALHGAFLAISTLRDYIAKYIAFVIVKKPRIDCMSELVKYLQKNKEPHHVTQHLLEATQDGGWLREFSTLRDIFAHRSPLGHGSGSPAVLVKRHVTPSGRLLHMLHVPLPTLEGKQQKQRPPFDDVEALREHYTSLSGCHDTLDYIYASMSRVLAVSKMVRNTFPYEPQTFSLTDKDIVGVSLVRRMPPNPRPSSAPR